jgi:hypothetical protein
MQHNGTERRASRRFSLQLPLSGWTLGKQRTFIAGETINIASRGILFTAREPIPINAKLEVHIDWPVRSGNGEQMELNGIALVVRTTRYLVGAHLWQCSLRPKNKIKSTFLAAG